MKNHPLHATLLASTLLGALALSGCNKTQVVSDLPTSPSAGASVTAPTMASGPTDTSDTAITSAVQAALLADPLTHSMTLQVQTLRGDVSLNGMVTDTLQAQAASTAARRVLGVKSVNNQLIVQTANSAVPSSADDQQVTLRVKTALENDGNYKTLDIQVITLKGDVRLVGVVDNATQREEALRLVRGVEGVHSIHDELRVK
jgi:hyperosmotically inducible periplasmic protein